MQIRLDPDIVRLIKRNADEERRIFKRHGRIRKRRLSYAAVVNEALRCFFEKEDQSFVLSPEAAGVERSKEVKLFQRIPNP